ncbi:MAG: hypothetical protein IRZ31_20615 [Thermogemmatispora sp.]|uniref:hypothetical protein n=1 Tax=Thermogemmatispora sp. TaxID=1968838 RepID=UPI00261E7868|nr:hypothetical protein [Thermogemmatispora sp.]MBX5459303.1 hypothetical protein [Thermogemmatispora sp.]
MTTESTLESFAGTLADVSAELVRTQEQYDTFALARLVPFPGYRRRHAILRRLCGIYPCQRSVPSWWHALLDELARFGVSPSLIALLREVEEPEFYGGCLLGAHAERLKEIGACSGPPRPAWTRSPRLGKILEALGQREGSEEERQCILRWYQQYQNRGAKEGQRILIISAHPWDILSMGSGRSYRTCQALDQENVSSYQRRLPSNLLDAGMLVAYIPSSLEAIRDRWTLQRMEARCILRLLFCPHLRRWVIYIDRCYGDVSLSQMLRAGIEQLLEQRGIASSGYVGSGSPASFLPVRGRLLSFPDGLWEPYLDGDALSWIDLCVHGRSYARLEGHLFIRVTPGTERSAGNALDALDVGP